ncbi:MAG: HPr family phosphocarrier protein [Spirochaetales bacterium]|nr:HPr family phosphocarrier protein [Spirochaetales bacterium]
MISREIEIVNETGLHTRPGNQFVKLAKTFESEITVRKGDREFSGKSLLKLMKIGISLGDRILITCSGEDEETALDELCRFVAALTE